MVHAHLSLSRPSLLSFVRAYLWQLERTGALLAVTEAEQRAAQEAAEALYAAASDRDQRSRLFGEFRQLVEQHVATPSHALQAVIARLERASQPASAEASSAASSDEVTPASEAVVAEAVVAEVSVAEAVVAEAVVAEAVVAEVSVAEAPVVAAVTADDDVPVVERSGEVPIDDISDASDDVAATSDEAALAQDVTMRSVARRRRERR
ncbi:MAG: hypothetical protein U0745_16670 [Polyangia bacterium]